MSDNQLNICSYPNRVRNIKILAHQIRILHSALRCDSQTLVTCATDENLKFWKLFEKCPSSSGSASVGSNITGKGNKMAKQKTIWSIGIRSMRKGKREGTGEEEEGKVTYPRDG